MLDTAHRRVGLLIGLAALLGLAGGVAAWALLKLIAVLTNLALFHRWATELPSFAGWHPTWTLIPIAAAGGLAISLLSLKWPAIRGHGIPETMEVVLTRHSRIPPGIALAKPASAAIAIGTGGPFGAEGPIIVTGGALGSLAGQLLHVSPAERKILLSCGAAAGMAATFGSPIAAVMLAIELLLFEFSSRALIPLIVSSSVAAGVHSLLLEPGPLFSVPAHDYSGLSRLPVFAVVGLLCGLMAVVIARGLFFTEALYRRLPVGEFWHPVIGACGFALVGLMVPQALGVGYDAIGDVLHSRLALGTLLTLGIAKLVAWWVALGSGTSGGTLAPMLLISGCFGGALGLLLEQWMPWLDLSPGAVALVSMAATFGAATGATFAAIVFLFELTGDYQVILPLMLATVMATFVTRALMAETLMTEKLARRGVKVGRAYEVDALRHTLVRDAMTARVETLPSDATVAEAKALLKASSHHAYPLVDGEGRCAGIVARSDLLLDTSQPFERVSEICEDDPVMVDGSDTLAGALETMLAEGVEQLAVVDSDERLTGILTRTDILKVRLGLVEQETRQTGWLPLRRGVAMDRS
ncbi:MAG TPA: chloride channel protein [Actinomycetota bacterium]|nr:chloride channel protein [Actinomycetota bacterium]